MFLIGQKDFQTSKISLRRHSNSAFERRTMPGFAKPNCDDRWSSNLKLRSTPSGASNEHPEHESQVSRPVEYPLWEPHALSSRPIAHFLQLLRLHLHEYRFIENSYFLTNHGSRLFSK